MTASVRAVLEEAIRPIASRSAVIFIGISAAVQLLARSVVQEGNMIRAMGAQLLPIPLLLLVSLVLVFGASAVLVVVALQTFVEQRAGQWPRFRGGGGDLQAAVTNMMVGGVIFSLMLALGLTLLVVPGIVVLVYLILWPAFVAVEGMDSESAMKRSRAVVEEKPWSVGKLVAAAAVVVAAIGATGDLVMALGDGSVLAVVGWAMLGGARFVFILSFIATLYRYLVE